MFKKLLTIFVSLTLISPATPIFANEKPEVLSFTASKSELDTFDTSLKIEFELVVSHENGISDSSTTLNLGTDGKYSLTTSLKRTDNPINFSLKKVIFRGEVDLPRTFPAGVYEYSVNGVSSNLYNGRIISSGVISAPAIRKVKGAESGILLRNNGYLDLTEDILNGPSYSTTNGQVYENPAKFLSAPTPIFRVGETLDPKSYYEVAVDEVGLSVEANTSSTCKVTNNILVFTGVGACTYTVTTSRSKNYSSQFLKDSVVVDVARQPQALYIAKVPNQSAANIPINIQLDPVYSSGVSNVQYVFPETQSKDVCDVSGYILRIISGGVCKLTYMSSGNDKFLPSSLYTQEIIVERKSQSINFQVPASLNSNQKNLRLNATSSSGAPVLFSSDSQDICTIKGDYLYLTKAGVCKITATQTGTAFFEPISELKTISILAESRKSKCDSTKKGKIKKLKKCK